MTSTSITPGEGGNDSPASKIVRKTGKASSGNSSTESTSKNQTQGGGDTTDINSYNADNKGAGQGNN